MGAKLHHFLSISTKIDDFVNEIPRYHDAKFYVLTTSEQISRQQNLPFTLYITGVNSPILSKKEKVETLWSVHCECFYTHTHNETRRGANVQTTHIQVQNHKNHVNYVS